MEVAAAAPAFDALAFAFAAFAFALVAGALLINPLNALAAAASGLPVVGGALSWAFSYLADLVSSAVDYVNYQKQQAYGQATSWWNWIVTSTIGAYYGDVNGKFADLYWRANNLWNQVYGTVAYQIGDLYAQVSNLWNLAYSTLNAVNSLAYYEIPRLRADIGALSSRATALEADVYNLKTFVIAALNDRVGTLEREAQDFAHWRDFVGNQVLPRMQQDINVRAFEPEAEWLRQQLGQAQFQLSILLPLSLLALAGVDAISNLRCHMDIPCDPLTALTQNDVLDRLNNLEIGEG